MPEYLDEVRVKYNTDKYTAVEIITDKNTYTAKLPYTEKAVQKLGRINTYSINIKDWCRLRHIIMKEYFGYKNQGEINP